MLRPPRPQFVSAAVIAVALLSPARGGAARPPSPQRPTFTSTTEAWWMTATVIGPDGHLVTELTKDDFEVRDNGEVRPISAFRSDRIPFAIVTMFDLSGSMADNLGIMRRAMRELVSRFEVGDRANIGTFASVPYLSPRFSGNASILQSWVTATLGGGAAMCQGDFLVDNDRATLRSRLLYPGSTAIWDAVDCGIDAAASDGETPRRVVLVVTDGMDNVSTRTLEQVIQQANQDGVMVYGIVMNGNDPHGIDRDAVKSLADSTGGGFFMLSTLTDLSATFARVAEELRHQYVFGFSPAASADAKHKIEVKTRTPGTTTRARRVYMMLNPVMTAAAPGPPPAASPMSKVPAKAAPRTPAPSGPPETKPSSPAAAGDLASLLGRFEHGDWDMFYAAPPTPEDLQTLLKWLRLKGASWTAAEGAASERQRRLALATFVLQLLNTEEDPLLWFGGGTPSISALDPRNWTAGYQQHIYDEPLPATELLEWAAAFLKAEPPLLAERWWHLGAIALLEREHATEALSFESDEAHARFPSEDRFVLARAIAADELTWPQIRDGRTMLVDPKLYVAIADRYREASARESVKPEAEIRMGYFELRRGHPDLALADFNQAGTPTEPALRYWLGLFQGEALEQSGRNPDALAAYRRAFDAAPFAQSAAVALAAALENAHRPTEGAALASRTLSVQQAPFDPWWIYTFPDIRFWPRLTAELHAAVTVTK